MEYGCPRKARNFSASVRPNARRHTQLRRRLPRAEQRNCCIQLLSSSSAPQRTRSLPLCPSPFLRTTSPFPFTPPVIGGPRILGCCYVRSPCIGVCAPGGVDDMTLLAAVFIWGVFYRVHAGYDWPQSNLCPTCLSVYNYFYDCTMCLSLSRLVTWSICYRFPEGFCKKFAPVQHFPIIVIFPCQMRGVSKLTSSLLRNAVTDFISGACPSKLKTIIRKTDACAGSIHRYKNR